MEAPAFQLYPADFYMDTGEWTVEEIGIYTRLLFSEWINGDLPDDPQRLARIAGCGSKKFKKAWPIVTTKFVHNGQLRLINKKMESVREKQRKYRESQSEAGKRGAEKRWKTDSNPIDNPIDNPNGETIALQSSPSSSSPNNKEQATPDLSKGHYADQISTNYVEQIDHLCEWLEKKYPGYPYKFTQQSYKNGCHPQAIVDVLRTVKRYIQMGMLKKGPWPVSNTIIKKLSGNYHERENTRAYEAIKQELLKCDLPHIKNLFGSVF